MPLVITGLDIETTGLSQEDGHRIIEIACILFRTDDGIVFEKAGSWTQRINPCRSIDAKAQAVHGIAYADLLDKPKWGVVAPKVLKILRATNICVAHNGEGFDFPFLIAELLREGLPIPAFDIFDTMLSGRDATAMGKVPSLKEYCWSYGVEYDTEKAHAALYDVQVMMSAFFTAYKRKRVVMPSLSGLTESKLARAV